MKRVLLTGGTGVLGRRVVEQLKAQGYTARVMSRRSGAAEGVEWARADLETGEGLAEAVKDVEVIVHAATNPRNLLQVRNADVNGTARLLGAARAAGVQHFIYISIVGIEKVPYFYYRIKLEAEQLTKNSGLPWSILRATQFYDFPVELLFRPASRLPLLPLLPDFPLQPVDVGEVAGRLVRAVADGPKGMLRDFAGPEVLSLRHMAKSWLEAQNLHKPIWQIPMFGSIIHGLKQGYLINPQAEQGQITWEQWLKRKYKRSTNPISN